MHRFYLGAEMWTFSEDVRVVYMKANACLSRRVSFKSSNAFANASMLHSVVYESIQYRDDEIRVVL